MSLLRRDCDTHKHTLEMKRDLKIIFQRNYTALVQELLLQVLRIMSVCILRGTVFFCLLFCVLGSGSFMTGARNDVADEFRSRGSAL